jgi:EPS-associated MarR family transcriptional regulator
MTDQELEYKILKLLEQKSDQTQRQLALALGVSLGKTHYLVKSLIDVGCIKLDNFQKSNNKWSYIYLLTPKGIKEKSTITAHFLTRKQSEYNKLRKEILELKREVRHHTINIK